MTESMSRNPHTTAVVFHGRLARLLDRPSIAARGDVRLRRDRRHRAAAERRVYLFSYLRDLTHDADETTRLIQGHNHYVLFQDDTPIETVAEVIARLRVGTSDRLHVARLEHDTARAFVRRFLAGLVAMDNEGSIMDAWWNGDELVVISPKLQRLHVPASRLPKLAAASRKDRMMFTIDSQGAFVHWPACDVHLGWAQLQQLVDPQARLRAQQKSADFNHRYGAAIRHLRHEHGLTQSQIPGLDARTVRRIESGRTRATANALSCLAAAHAMDVNAYMNEVARRLPR